MPNASRSALLVLASPSVGAVPAGPLERADAAAASSLASIAGARDLGAGTAARASPLGACSPRHPPLHSPGAFAVAARAGEPLEIAFEYACTDSFVLTETLRVVADTNRYVACSRRTCMWRFVGFRSHSVRALMPPAPRTHARTRSTPAEFFFTKDCRARGCSERCLEHGECVELLGEVGGTCMLNTTQ